MLSLSPITSSPIDLPLGQSAQNHTDGALSRLRDHCGNDILRHTFPFSSCKPLLSTPRFAFSSLSCDIALSCKLLASTILIMSSESLRLLYLLPIGHPPARHVRSSFGFRKILSSFGQFDICLNVADRVRVRRALVHLLTPCVFRSAKISNLL